MLNVVWCDFMIRVDGQLLVIIFSGSSWRINDEVCHQVLKMSSRGLGRAFVTRD